MTCKKQVFNKTLEWYNTMCKKRNSETVIAEVQTVHSLWVASALGSAICVAAAATATAVVATILVIYRGLFWGGC